MVFDKDFLGKLFEQAVENPRLRLNFDLRTSDADTSQRMLNALLPGTQVPIHRHPNSTENVILLCGKLIEVVCDEDGNELERIHLDPSVGNYGCVIPQGAWHTVEVLEPSVIYEAKDGKYDEDGSEALDAYTAKNGQTISTFSNSLGDLKKNIAYLIGMERQSGNVGVVKPLDISQRLNVPLEEVEKVMKDMGI